MSAGQGGAALITGANSGIGKEVARQLADLDAFDTIYLACRNEAKAQAAQTDLERVTGKSIFTTVLMDTSDPGSVRTAVGLIDSPVRAVVMNAGGTGGSAPLAATKDGVTELFASNVLGHVVLLEELIATGALTTAVLVGSEAARGVPKLGMKRPEFSDHSVAEFASVIDGSFFAGAKFDARVGYGQVKYLGALWMSDLARRHPDLRLLTVSPGNTAGTDVFRDMPPIVRTADEPGPDAVRPAAGRSRAPCRRGRTAPGRRRGGRRAGQRSLLCKRRQHLDGSARRPGRHRRRLRRPHHPEPRE